jgi:hypothetical protein
VYTHIPSQVKFTSGIGTTDEKKLKNAIRPATGRSDTWRVGKMLHQSLAYSANPQTYDRNWSCGFRYFIRFNIFPFFSPPQFNLASLNG